MSLKGLLDRLTPMHPGEQSEWEDALAEYDRRFRKQEPVLFWYLSSGFDTQALAFFSDKDTAGVYKTPSVDIFLYSDYSPGCLDRVMTLYDLLDDGPVEIYHDHRPQAGGILTRMAVWGDLLEDEARQHEPQECRTHIAVEGDDPANTLQPSGKTVRMH